MRLGGPVLIDNPDPQQWVHALQMESYRAAYCPVKPNTSQAEIHAFEKAAKQANILIAEVGAWCNPISTDEDEAYKAIQFCQDHLALADEIGAVCCVNISGSRGPRWDGPDPKNLTPETFDLIVTSVQSIIDAVKPKRAFYTLEAMPWIYPDSPDSFLDLLQAVDRKQFAVHLDPVNMICSPQRYFSNAAFLRECFEKLGPYIKSCHAKDILLSDQLTTHLDETRPGLGCLDYSTYLRELNRLPEDTPLMLEHLTREEEYQLAAETIRAVGKEQGINL
jgi:sugar phosphate isomerase/epimerase